ncbi:MAG: hypothetical protein ACFE9R_06210 [Candidatus Hermodarchaeota archaeon]
MPKVLVILNKMLMKRLIKSYSIQIQTNSKSRERIFLYFEDQEKERILTTFNLIHQKLNKEIKAVRFFKKGNLKREFFNIFSNKITPHSDVIIDKDSIRIQYDQKSLLIKCYQIKIDLIHDRIEFIPSLMQLLNNLNSYGFLVFNVRINNFNEINLNSYYLSIAKKEKDQDLNLENEINSLYESPIFKAINIKLQSFYKILWRKALGLEFSVVKDLFELFLTFSVYDFQNSNLFIDQLQKMFRLNKIEVHKLNPNLLHVSPSALYLTLNNADIGLVEKVITEYKTTHKIYLIDLSTKDSHNSKLKNIELIQNLKLLTFKDIINLDFLKIKNQT